ATAAAVKGTYHINVSQLAENWSSASSEAISVGDTGNIADQLGLDATDTINFTIDTNQGSVTINKTGLDSVSMSDIITEINQANIGVTAIYDSSLDRFFLQTENTGTDNTVSISDSSVLTGGDKFITGSNNKLKLQYLDSDNNSQVVADGVAYQGKDAIIDFGAATNISQSSNAFTINNVSFNLKATGESSLTVATDTDAVLDKISSFVEKYNEIVEIMGGKLTEKKYSDYRPLTDEQRESLTDKQIEQWEEKGKSGLLSNDYIVDRSLLSFRTGMYQKVEGIEGVFSQLTEIGITTETYSSGSRGGKLVINEAKLRGAIEGDSQSVLELLFKEPDSELAIKPESQMTSTELQQKRSQSGLISRLYDNVVTGMKSIVFKAGTGDEAELYRSVNSTILIDFVVEYSNISMLEKDADDLTDKLEGLYKHLDSVEDRYWRQFSAMEKALQKMNQQSSWLMQQLGGTS
ncbi:MAG: flagellar filament capping protein FliD, partial [Clostridia bacterium]|nr:flagellar filament capping protein FliD [Clostridia bacterium]